ncbi:hypothetical protein OF83DRAFT_1141173 [Amylostereum chailletii]|nr:hypothetical protein OF83DRAFT_1141173 [Amylostereum chailletii]
MSDVWVPTVDDLRVKLCYICREEERYDDPHATRWTHPCTCTLVAHEACLLQWIKSAQQSTARARNALKCPQCGARYELQSANPPLLRFLNGCNRALSSVGRIFTVVGVGTIVTSFGAGIYFLSTSYGAFALREFLGPEMYSLLLTDDISRWPWHAYLNLPLIPMSLIISRLPVNTSISPLIPLLFAWPSSFPATPAPQSLFSAATIRIHRSLLPLDPASMWPPSPTLICVAFPAIRALYRAARAKIMQRVIDTDEPLPLPGPVRRLVWALGGDGDDDGPGIIRININADVERQPQLQPQERRAEAQGQAVPQQQLQAEADGNDIPVHVPAQQEVQVFQNGQRVDNLPGADQEQQDDQEPEDDNAGAAAARTLRITGASVGRVVGGALMMPTIAKTMGALLLRASRSLPLLRMLLAPRPHLAPTVWRWDTPEVGKSGPWGITRVLMRLLVSGNRAWIESDPVWWRNSLGLGLFIVIKDCVKLVHLYLAKQELESRHLKDRNFAGIDLRELDLINPPPDRRASV